MKKLFNLLLIIVFLAAAGCTEIKQGLGIEKDIPDEFLVKKKEPLKIPPDYNLIPPGEKKIKETSKINSNDKVKDVVDQLLKGEKETDINSSVNNKDLEKELLDKISN